MLEEHIWKFKFPILRFQILSNIVWVDFVLVEHYDISREQINFKGLEECRTVTNRALKK